MAARARRLLLTVHVIASVGWLGAIGAFVALAVVGLTSNDVQLVRGVYLASEPLALFAIVPLALASLLTGVVQSLVTTWGLFRHYWVIVKLGITVFASLILLTYTQTVDHVADIAAAAGSDLEAMRSPSFLLHSGVGMVLLLIATALAVFKPRGLTRRGWRKQQELVAAAGRRSPTPS